MHILVAPASALRRWDIKHIATVGWLRPAHELRPFGTVAARRQRVAPHGPPLGSIHFDGRISVRVTTELKGRTFVALPGDLVFSKIDIRNGAIGVVPVAPGALAFSAEYPIYDLDATGELLPAFARLLCRTRAFRAQVGALVSGHSGRKRVTPEQFESIPVPVPPLEEQRAVVAFHEAAQARVDALRHRAPTHLDEALAEVARRLGLAAVRMRAPRHPFVARVSWLSRWSVGDAAALAHSAPVATLGPYPAVPLGTDGLARLLRGVSKAPTNRPGEHARPYLRVANVQVGGLDLRDVRTIDVPDADLDRLLLHRGDVLICRNNSLDLVGKAALWQGEIAGCTHDDHVFRLRVDQGRLVPEYVLAVLSTKFARDWFRSRAQITTNLAGIPGSAVTDLPIPLPPRAEQEAIATLVSDARGQMQADLNEAGHLELQTALAVEDAIARGRPLPAIAG